MYVIGLTGSLGTGKSTVAAMFKDLGAKVIDADSIARKLMQPGESCFRPVVRLFGKDVLKNGKIDREKIADQVFKNPGKRKQLEGIIHPAVRRVISDQVKEFRKKKRKRPLILDVPLLFETKMNEMCDGTFVVKAKRAIQIARAVKSLGITKAEARRRISAQMPLRQKIRLADMIIDNDGTKKQTQKQVIQIWERL